MRLVACSILLVAGCGRFGFEDEDYNMDPMNPAPFLPGEVDGVATPPTDGLLAYWSFDNMTPTGVTSVVGTNQATCNAGECPTAEPGVSGVAARFNGTSTCYHVPSLANLDAASYTISVWARLDTTMSAQPMVMRYTGGCASPSIRSNTTDTSYAAYDLNDVHQYASTDTAVLQAQTWQQIAIRWDGANQSIFINGLCACNNLPALALRMAVTSEFTIGCDSYDGKRLAGSLDTLRIYDRALRNDEMAALVAEDGREPPMPAACPKQCTITPDFP